MSERHITCINKPHHHNSHEHITHIGNSQEQWRIEREEAIHLIESKQQRFYTIDKTTQRKCHIEVVREKGKAPYLRSHADGKPNDNLLEQSECGSSCKIGLPGGITSQTPTGPVDLRGGGRHG
jgi:hypothetical protein